MAKIGGTKTKEAPVAVKPAAAAEVLQPVTQPVTQPKATPVAQPKATPVAQVATAQPEATEQPEATATVVTEPGQKVLSTPKKEVKKLEPKAWQRLDVSNPDKPILVDQITFLGELIDYEPGFRADYGWHNLDIGDGLRRVVTGKFPKADVADSIDDITFQNYRIIIQKYGNSAVCRLEDEENQILVLEYVSLATVLDVLQDLVNPKGEDGKGTCTIPWGTIDQVIKRKRNLKSRIKNLSESDLPLRSKGRNQVAAIEAEVQTTTEEVQA